MLGPWIVASAISESDRKGGPAPSVYAMSIRNSSRSPGWAAESARTVTLKTYASPLTLSKRQESGPSTAPPADVASSPITARFALTEALSHNERATPEPTLKNETVKLNAAPGKTCNGTAVAWARITGTMTVTAAESDVVACNWPAESV